jgi:hypothetical protein
VSDIFDLIGWILLSIPAALLLIFGFFGLLLASIILYVIAWSHEWPRHRPFIWLAGFVCRRFDLPIGEQLSKFRDIIWDRYNEHSIENNIIPNKDRAIAYGERIIDRQINKARGILPFNSILLVLVGPARNGILIWEGTEISGLLLKILWAGTIFDLMISSILLLEIFTVFWGSISIYEDWKNEITTSFRLSRNRSVILDVAILLSAICVISTIIVVFSVPLFAVKR